MISANRNLERYATLGWPVVTDTVGPLAGLLRLLETARHDSLLCVPCHALDTPGTGPRAVGWLWWMEETNIAVLEDGERGHPTCCLVQWDLANDLRRFLQNRGRAM